MHAVIDRLIRKHVQVDDLSLSEMEVGTMEAAASCVCVCEKYIKLRIKTFWSTVAQSVLKISRIKSKKMLGRHHAANVC